MLSEPPRVDCGHFTAEVTNGDLHIEVETKSGGLGPGLFGCKSGG